MPPLPVSRGPGGEHRAVWQAAGNLRGAGRHVSGEQAPRRVGDHEVFAGRHTQNRRSTAGLGEHAIIVCIRQQAPAEPEDAEPTGDPITYRRGMLPDPAREHERVKPRQRGRRGGDPLRSAAGEQLDRE